MDGRHIHRGLLIVLALVIGFYPLAMALFYVGEGLHDVFPAFERAREAGFGLALSWPMIVAPWLAVKAVRPFAVVPIALLQWTCVGVAVGSFTEEYGFWRTFATALAAVIIAAVLMFLVARTVGFNVQVIDSL